MNTESMFNLNWSTLIQCCRSFVNYLTLHQVMLTFYFQLSSRIFSCSELNNLRPSQAKLMYRHVTAGNEQLLKQY